MEILDKLKDSLLQIFTTQRRRQTRYLHEKLLGSGASGEVWLANDTLLNRPVAIKYLKATKNTLHKELFLSEAQILARLNHPNITLIYDATFDPKQHRFHLVMEYVEGQPLSELIDAQTEPLPLDTTLHIAIGIAQALQSAHEQGIVHRDVKPANVMLQAGKVKLTDFGVAGLMSILSNNTRQGVGSLSYMSPEQIRGGKIDGRADLYALGIILFEMISGGYIPFSRETREEMIEAHLNELPLSPKKFAPNLPLALEHTVLRLLAKEPDSRFSSAQAVIDTLSAIQARLKLSQPHLNLLEVEIKPLAGRETELEQLATAWQKCQQTSQPHLLVIQGTIGMGKTSLVTTFLGQQVIDKGFMAIAGRCNPSGIPYAPYAEILATILNKRLSNVMTAAEIDSLTGHIPGLARLLDVAKANQTPGSGQTEDAQTAQWQFFTTVLTILADLGPTVIFLEDATFLDEASIALSLFLIRQPQLPLLVVAANRTGDEHHTSWLNLFSTSEKQVISLTPLATSAIKAILENLLDGPFPERIVALVKQRSQGTPLHIEEVTRQLIDTGELKRSKEGQWRYRPATKPMETPVSFLTKSVFNVFVRRIKKLSEPSREALTIAALIEPGAEFDFDIWVELMGGESQESFAQQVLQEAMAERVVRQVGDRRYSLHPPDLARALTNDFPQDEAAQYHRKIADLLQRKEASPTLIGYHYEQAGQTNEAAHYLERAAAEAAAANATKTAIEFYNRVTALKESLNAYKALGQLYRQQGDWDNSLLALQQAYELIKEENNVTALAQILNGLSFTLWLYDDYREAYAPAAAVLELEGVPETELAAAQSHLGMISWLVGELNKAEDWCQKSVKLLETGKDEVNLAGAYNRLGLVHFSQGKLAEAYRVVQYSLDLREKLGDYWEHAFSLVNLGKVVAAQGNFDKAFTLFDTAHELFKKVNSQDGLMILSTSYGWALLQWERYEEALSWLTKAEQFAVKIGKHTAYGLSYIYLLEAQARLALYELETARKLTNEALELVQEAGNREYIAIALTNLANIHAAERDSTTAEEMFRQAMILFEQVGSQTGLLQTRLNYARFLAQQGQAQAAATIEQEVRTTAADIGAYFP